MLEIGKTCPNIRLFRNNTGVALAINKGRGSWNAMVDACAALCRKMGGNASPVKYGLHVGSADLIGWEMVIITQEMVGGAVAVFVSVECKSTTGTVEPEQKTWANNVRAAGGKAIVARSVDEALSGLVCGRLL